MDAGKGAGALKTVQDLVVVVTLTGDAENYERELSLCLMCVPTVGSYLRMVIICSLLTIPSYLL